MREYADVDDVIEAWVAQTGSTLFRGWGGKPARFFYLGRPAPFECFMVAVFVGAEGWFDVQAASIETNDGAEMMEVWQGPANQMDSLLRNAMATIKTWKERPR